LNAADDDDYIICQGGESAAILLQIIASVGTMNCNFPGVRMIDKLALAEPCCFFTRTCGKLSRTEAGRSAAAVSIADQHRERANQPGNFQVRGGWMWWWQRLVSSLSTSSTSWSELRLAEGSRKSVLRSCIMTLLPHAESGRRIEESCRSECRQLHSRTAIRARLSTAARLAGC
jgi:hypothetical protein